MYPKKVIRTENNISGSKNERNKVIKIKYHMIGLLVSLALISW